MSSSMDIWFGGNKELIWDKFCGHLYLKMPAFKHIQESLLMEQVKLLQGCELGRKLLGNQSINSVEEFRQKVPITTYEDYEPYLSKKREEVLPARPKTWSLTTGIAGQQKWIPISDKAYEVLADAMLALFILSTARGAGKFSLSPGDKMFIVPPPPPLFHNLCLRELQTRFGLKMIPSQDDWYMKASFQERIDSGFKIALRSGIDIAAGTSRVLVDMGERFFTFKKSAKKNLGPRANYKFLMGWIKSHFNDDLQPRHLWKLKSVVGTGMDITAFSPRIKFYWGNEPFEFYINTEFGCYLGSYTWTRKGMTFVPYMGFLEFIPIENAASKDGKGKGLNTVLLDQVKPGEIYEVVFTNFNGGAFVRYRPGDAIKFISLEDKDSDISLPQFIVKGRADKLIDIAGYTRIDEKTIWQALESSGIKYNKWIARKEIVKGEPVLSLYLDCPDGETENHLYDLLHNKLKQIDASYKNLEEISGIKPLRIQMLPSGTLSRWEDKMLKEGKDMGWVMEQHLQAADEVVEEILKVNREQN